MWQLIMYLPPARDQQWKNLISCTVPSMRTLLYRSATSISSGVPSIKMCVHSKNIGMVVKRTSTENTYVQIGSAIYHSGLNLMMIAAAITPIL